MVWLKGFFAGFLSTLVFHQGVFSLFYMSGVIPKAPYNMTSVPPFGVPSVISLAFFGGLWGALIWALIRKDSGAKHWIKAVLFGAVGPTAVALFVVFPMKGIEVVPMMGLFGLILNGAWGFGNSLFMVVFKERPGAI